MRNVNNPSDETGPKPVCTCVAHHILLSFDQYKVFIVNVSDNACDNDLNSWHPFYLSQINQLFATNELIEMRTAVVLRNVNQTKKMKSDETVDRALTKILSLICHVMSCLA